MRWLLFGGEDRGKCRFGKRLECLVLGGILLDKMLQKATTKECNISD